MRSVERELTESCCGVGSFALSRLKQGAKLGSSTTAGPRSNCTPRYEAATGAPTVAPSSRSCVACMW